MLRQILPISTPTNAWKQWGESACWYGTVAAKQRRLARKTRAGDPPADVSLIPTVTKPVQAMFLSIPCWDNMYSVCYYMHWTSHKGSVTCLWAVAYYTFYLEILNYRIQKTSRAKRFLVFFQCSPTVVGLVYWVVNCFNYFIRSNKMSAGKGQSLNIQPQQTAAFGKIFTTVRRRW